MRIPVPLRHAYRLLNHGPTTLITTAHAGRRNVMAAAWVMPLDFNPPRFVAVIAADTFTRELLEASGQCAVMLPTTEQLDLTLAVGSCSGRDTDKFAAWNLTVDPGTQSEAPLLHGCAAWLECSLCREPELQQRYDLCVLDCHHAWVDDRLWADGCWRFPAAGPRTIHHSKGGLFHPTGDARQAGRPVGGA